MRFTFTTVITAAALFTPAAFAANIGNLVVAGDSLSAGYQNAQLIDCSQPAGNMSCFGKPSGQKFGYANIIAQQAAVDLKLPLIQPPGYPKIAIIGGVVQVVDVLTPPIREDGGANQTLDVSVPGYTVGAMVGYPPVCPPNPALPPDLAPPFPIQVMALAILNPSALYSSCSPTPTELIEAATVAQSHPGTAILWIGSNDALFPLLFTGFQTPQASFNAAFEYAAGTMAASSQHLVIANIPDVTLLPYLTSVPKLATITGLPVQLVEAIYHLAPGDMVTPYAFAYLQNFTALPNDDGLGDPVVIRQDAIAALRQTVIAYNQEIAAAAAAKHATLVDIYSLVNDLAAHGITVGGQKLTTDFMGGLFSLDGIHPSNTGYAIIANEFIKTMNRQLGAGIAPVSIEQVSKNDPFVFPSTQRGQGHVSQGMADALHGALGKH